MLPRMPPPAADAPDPSPAGPPLWRIAPVDAHTRWLHRDARRGGLNTLLTLALLLVWCWLGVRAFRSEMAPQEAASPGCSAQSSRAEPAKAPEPKPSSLHP